MQVCHDSLREWLPSEEPSYGRAGICDGCYGVRHSSSRTSSSWTVSFSASKLENGVQRRRKMPECVVYVWPLCLAFGK